MGLNEWLMRLPPTTTLLYDKLRESLGKRYPQADRFLLDHLVSLEGFLDKSITFGFSYVALQKQKFARPEASCWAM